ncbi:AMP-dependent synthetase/ligase [Penicillium cf. griseofulvum]|uniref:AMP-dependent synthetase/ligase n=1 Tax=Penicillium cf. griseofulvum TaxID=2972120 RepID=A0A9W9MFT3_9EURO|nr:AMP-dependent synthetase/ligase [Penicillium cf. griseofulvum]KAJ5423329.1 AMP-dependent synthetase/ligase [Penicillium cf. griseofulvum]KAJ5431402.1 AMP-dependent synthetase/ligase [Penicillium cf. griseofulvum]
MDYVCFGFMLSGRDAPIPEVNSVLGPFINLKPCMVKPSQETILSTMFQDFFNTDMKTVEQNQNCSIADIDASLGMKEPLFSTFLNMQQALDLLFESNPDDPPSQLSLL